MKYELVVETNKIVCNNRVSLEQGSTVNTLNPLGVYLNTFLRFEGGVMRVRGIFKRGSRLI